MLKPSVSAISVLAANQVPRVIMSRNEEQRAEEKENIPDTQPFDKATMADEPEPENKKMADQEEEIPPTQGRRIPILTKAEKKQDERETREATAQKKA